MPRIRRLLFLTVLAAAVFTGTAQAATYYVSPSGSDLGAGTSADAAWQSVARVDHASLQPGDTVLFEGGATFSDASLMPPSSGSPSSPISFGSYGVGRAKLVHSATVWLDSGLHDLVFRDLDLSAGGAASGIFTSSGSGPGVSNVVLRDSYLHDTAAEGIDSPQHNDHDWRIEGNTIRHTGDSGMILWGSNDSVVGNTIADTGWNTALTYAAHGIYAKGADMTIASNDISASLNGQAISLRYHGARVYGNAIHDTGYGIGFFDYDQSPAPQGLSYVYQNRFWNITGWGFYYDNQPDPQGHAPTVSFVLANNTFHFVGASEAVNVSLVPAGTTVELANNVFMGSYGSAYRSCSSCTEHHNDWSGAGWNIPSGVGDLRVEPALSAPSALAPMATSPVVDRGSASVAGLTFTAACDGQALHFCGLAPDMGASELLSLPSSGDVVAPSTPTSLGVTSTDATSISLAWTASTDDTGVAGYDVFLDGAKVASVGSAAATVTGLSCGTSYSLGVQALDAAGNRSANASTTGSTAPCPASAPAVVDTTPPTLSVSARSVGRTLTVQATAADAGGIRSLRFLLNGRSICLVSASTGSCRMTLAGSGRSAVTVEATDNAGNVASASIRIGGPRVSARQLAVQRYTSAAPAAIRRHVGRRR